MLELADEFTKCLRTSSYPVPLSQRVRGFQAAQAELLPDEKRRAIASHKSAAPIGMVGINDAPALVAASVGIAMGGGTDVALETADAALLRNQVGDVAELVSLSRATLSNIWQNFALALGLKGVPRDDHCRSNAAVGGDPCRHGRNGSCHGQCLRLLRFRREA